MRVVLITEGEPLIVEAVTEMLIEDADTLRFSRRADGRTHVRCDEEEGSAE